MDPLLAPVLDALKGLGLGGYILAALLPLLLARLGVKMPLISPTPPPPPPTKPGPLDLLKSIPDLLALLRRPKSTLVVDDDDDDRELVLDVLRTALVKRATKE